MTSEASTNAGSPKKHLKTRLFSVLALATTVCGLGYVGSTVYRIATDAFVAPIALTPDSDLVIQSKLALGQLLAERLKTQTKREQIDATVTAADEAIGELRALKRESERSLEWTKSVSAKQVSTGTMDLGAIAKQEEMTRKLVERQRDLVEKMNRDLAAGLVAKADVEKETQALGQLEMMLVDRERAKLATELVTTQAAMAQQALRASSRDGLSTPEMSMQRDQIVRIQCDLLKLEAERRAALTERAHLDEELEKLDELVAGLKSRPVFRATEANTNVAFVPYTQIDGVEQDARVFDCVWGVFACKSVGKVSSVLPGEVIVPDPWGTPTRGVYALLDLSEQRAAESRVLRVRRTGVAFGAPPTPKPEPSKLAKR